MYYQHLHARMLPVPVATLENLKFQSVPPYLDVKQKQTLA